MPQPVRLVGWRIGVGCINKGKVEAPTTPVSTKRPEEVEEEVESEVLTIVVFNSKNRVRLANTAYKEMVGQPQCSWLDFMVGNGTGVRLKVGSRRINGEVMLDLLGFTVPTSSNRFYCKVTDRMSMQWEEDAQSASSDEDRSRLSLNMIPRPLVPRCRRGRGVAGDHEAKLGAPVEGEHEGLPKTVGAC
ncbi:hypothetical protein Taro_021189 [Colocasia esculenta]|uniref:Uncharacterized protein n=1 Tax=Colocasia esculenta TaxID=4460 RepID=A0A843V4M4_COLES|nr:hypothetical protein [Colocasia esculenta]